MISIVAELFNSLAIIVHKVFLLTSFIGQLIVATLTGITNTVSNIFEKLMLFLQILYEDNNILFSEEIPSFFNDVAETLGIQLNGILNGFGIILIDVSKKLDAVIDAGKYTTDLIVVVLSEVLFLLKDATIFLGNALWLIITFLPVHLPQLLQASFKCVKNILFKFIVDAYMVLLKCTNFMTDVPLESFVGITSAIIIVRLCIHFRAAILSQLIEVYWLLLRKLFYLYYTLYNYVTDSEVRVIAHMASGQDIAARNTNFSASEVDDDGGAESLCIICQERQKCVLTLPCRHVCLCAECCRRLYGYQRTCPICRTFIYHSVTVYL